jgi:predicted RNA-binding Zn-ribbon protein involved in translation (DUF1610 family)
MMQTYEFDDAVLSPERFRSAFPCVRLSTLAWVFRRFRFAVKSHKCPDCGSRLVRHSHKRTFAEHIVCRVLFVQPYRYSQCDTRFFQFGTHSARKFAH